MPKPPMTPDEARQIMDDLGISAAWLADRCGRARRTVQDWIGTGDRRRTTVIPDDIAAYLRARVKQHRALPVPTLPEATRGRAITRPADV
jgi:hypothetical protein